MTIRNQITYWRWLCRTCNGWGCSDCQSNGWRKRPYRLAVAEMAEAGAPYIAAGAGALAMAITVVTILAR